MIPTKPANHCRLAVELFNQLTARVHNYSKTNAKLGVYFDRAGIPDKAYVSISLATPDLLEKGLEPGKAFIGKATYWVQAGEVRNLTPEQFRFDVAGPFALGSKKEAQTFAVKLPNPENDNLFALHFERNAADVQEYKAAGTVNADKFILVPQGTKDLP
jgi:hypothetical protein